MSNKTFAYRCPKTLEQSFEKKPRIKENKLRVFDGRIDDLLSSNKKKMR